MPHQHPSDHRARDIDLAAWLQQLHSRTARERSTSLIVGATGHLILSDAESANVAAHLRERVLPHLVLREGLEEVVLVTGAALGADLVFVNTAQSWLTEAGLRCRLVALLPVPAEQLYEDWLHHHRDSGVQLSATLRETQLRALREAIDSAHIRVNLYARHELEEPMPLDAREHQYRRLAAVLAQRSEVLVAILRKENMLAPGGTAEVVDWRRNPSRIPAELSTWTSADAASAGRRLPMLIIDPSVSPAFENPLRAESINEGAATDSSSEAAVLARAEEALHAGNDLLCNDIVYRAIKRGLNSRRLQYLRILSLASAGSTELALSQYEALKLGTDDLDEDWLALQGRLQKDLGERGTAAAQSHFQKAAIAYGEGYRRWNGPYSGINAATMSLLAGDAPQARELAASVLTLLQGQRPQTGAARYFHHVTAAEAALLLGDSARCAAELSSANQLLTSDVARRSRTLHQLRAICAALAIETEVLSPLHLPPVVLIDRQLPWWNEDHSPHQRVQKLPATLRVGALVFFGLADLLDLNLAEALLDIGARIYPTLPCPSRQLKRICARRWGAATALRLEQVLNRAERVTAVRGFLESEADWCDHHTRATAIGLSVLRAQRLSSRWNLMQLRCDAEQLHCVEATQIDDIAANLPQALAQTGLSRGTQQSLAPAGRRMVGLLFADFAGFRRITDNELPQFWNEIMQAVALILDAHEERVLLRSTWGDALHVVTTDAGTAAEIAAEIQRMIEQRRGHGDGPLADLELRVALHYAAAYESRDPVQKIQTYYGSQLSFTARIEPIAPPGSVYASEALVARLALEAAGRYSADYAGEIELAKRFGKYRLFAIRRRS